MGRGGAEADGLGKEGCSQAGEEQQDSKEASPSEDAPHAMCITGGFHGCQELGVWADHKGVDKDKVRAMAQMKFSPEILRAYYFAMGVPISADEFACSARGASRIISI